ncbi:MULTISPECIES: GlxA family transcriptional regulator [unclassified Ruegeria]|uniref:GlxA family transcriptional regulator n=1 Tax=unclassified Ruegeria TaxID=2625375 RepID=UPI0014887627|nr:MULTISPECIES: GlxA family transcriptional regulator [unclassified Ruegeria]NOD77608.1 helix-turn-helix domain-containing protein [Ruegeria sp. HKCCD4332]NOD89812.1 helix-turn-helix domain-containing protein [Ruegeria sp. HKCCD4318]NOE14742.1 helix-turn-helix domain-containing protein [Ruegeria sp. HKCCD4318-2]NOG10905.1 GlxA family transcriptional regulator [Ruegeria sp. HKCCD4315]
MERSEFVQKGAHAILHGFQAKPVEFYFVLLPKVTMLAVNAAIEPLRIANQLTNSELYRWYTVSPGKQVVQGANLMRLLPDLSLEDVPNDGTCFICSGVEPEETIDKSVTNWVRRRWSHGHPVGAICTGAFTLARAGVLRNRKFTLHWENQPAFREVFPDLAPSPNLLEVDGPLYTCSGGTASLDMMLHAIANQHGNELASLVAEMCIHNRPGELNPTQRTMRSALIGSRNPKLAAAITLMENNIEAPLSLPEIADQAGLSRRQMERLFASHANQSPAMFYADLRLSHAYALLSGTSLSVAEISAATGFESASSLSKRFRRKYGLSPHQFTRSWKMGNS